jgi:hypothetical protein
MALRRIQYFDDLMQWCTSRHTITASRFISVNTYKPATTIAWANEASINFECFITTPIIATRQGRRRRVKFSRFHYYHFISSFSKTYDGHYDALIIATI